MNVIVQGRTLTMGQSAKSLEIVAMGSGMMNAVASGMEDNMRTYTKKLLGMIEDGLDKDTVIIACLNYMSEDDVQDMMRANDFIYEEEEEDNEEEEL